MRIILMGPPGVGKGTEAEFLEKHYHIPHISTGQIFRETMKEDTPLAKTLYSYVSQGLLVPDQVTNEVIKERLSKQDVQKGFLFDGYPRTLEQAEALDQILLEKNWNLDAIINIESPEEIIIGRLAGRRVCEICGRTYHIQNKKPTTEGICDFDGGKLIQRNDDKAETVLNRLRVYEKQTAPLIQYYEAHQAFMRIDGSISMHDTHQQILKAIGENK